MNRENHTENEAGSSSAPFDHPEQIYQTTSDEQVDAEDEKCLDITAFRKNPVSF